MKRRSKAFDLVYMAVGAVLIAICSWISIPTAVPFTLQTFAVFFVLSLLGGRRGTISIIVYIILGAVGVPVFSGFTGGFARLIGMTGGYIIGFIFIGLIYWITLNIFEAKLIVKVSTLLLGLLVCYAFGTAWFMVIYVRQSGAIGLGTALTLCVFPFIIPDLAKMALAIFLAGRVNRVLHISNTY